MNTKTNKHVDYVQKLVTSGVLSGSLEGRKNQLIFVPTLFQNARENYVKSLLKQNRVVGEFNLKFEMKIKINTERINISKTD